MLKPNIADGLPDKKPFCSSDMAEAFSGNKSIAFLILTEAGCIFAKLYRNEYLEMIFFYGFPHPFGLV